MEKLTLLIILFSLPSILFMLVANVTGTQKWLLKALVKLPAFVATILIVVYFLKQFSII